MLTLDQLKDLALLQTHKATQLEIMLARSQNVSEQLATQNNELRGMLPKDKPVLTEGDAAADLAGTPRPNNPTVFDAE